MAERYEFTVGPFIKASYAFEGGDLVFHQGVRRTAIPLAHVNAFAVRARPSTFGMAAAQLLVRTTDGRVRRMTISSDAPACRALLEALGERAPSADLTQLPWPEAAARLGVRAYPWYEGFLEPRSTIGLAMVCASSMAAGSAAGARDRVEGIAQASVFAIAAIAGIVLIASGFRRARKRRVTSRAS